MEKNIKKECIHVYDWVTLLYSRIYYNTNQSTILQLKKLISTQELKHHQYCLIGSFVPSHLSILLHSHSKMETMNSYYMLLSVQFSSVTQSCLTLCNPTDCSTPVLPVHHQLLEFTHTHVCWVSDAIQPLLCRPLFLPPSIFPHIRVFSNESALRIGCPKYWSFSFNISPSSEYPGLISFRIDWLDLLAVQGTLKSSPTPQFKSINSLVLSFLYSPNSHIHTWLLKKL